MSKPDHRPAGEEHESIHEQYVLGVRIVERSPSDADEPRYRFEAPEHQGLEFEDPEMAELYADVYFCANGFEEAGTGERGVPPVIIQAGRAVMAAYLLTQPQHDRLWVASFFGKKPERIERYASWVRGRAEEIRSGAEARGME